jgi:hypothetical protein
MEDKEELCTMNLKIKKKNHLHQQEVVKKLVQIVIKQTLAGFNLRFKVLHKKETLLYLDLTFLQTEVKTVAQYQIKEILLTM